MKKVVGFLGVIVLVVLIGIGWTFQPWMSPGRAVHISSTHLGDYDFQLWQRKNPGVTEPFATGLFARKQGGQWRAFLLDFQDSYRPHILLRKEDFGIAVLYGSEKVGFFDEEQQTYKRESNGRLDTGAVLDSAPPNRAAWRDTITPPSCPDVRRESSGRILLALPIQP